MRKRETRPPSPRQLRVGEAIRHALAHALERGEVRDPGLGGKSATVTEVRVSPDLRHATAFVVPFGGAGEPAAMTAVVAALNRAAPFLRHRVAEVVRTKFAPELVFRPDTTFDEAERIRRLFADPQVARDLGRAAPARKPARRAGEPSFARRSGLREGGSPRASKDAPLSGRGRRERR
jgi:ribosome-binding factor A